MQDESFEKYFPDDEKELRDMLMEQGVDIEKLNKDFENYHPRKLLQYQKIHEDAIEPAYNYESDSGFDLYSVEEVVIPAFSRKLVPTGLKFDIPDGTELQVRPKSGLALNKGLTVLNTPGTVDCGYTGEIVVIVFNTNPTQVTIDKGMKIAQAVLCPVINGKWVELKRIDAIGSKDRGENGFGSTGI